MKPQLTKDPQVNLSKSTNIVSTIRRILWTNPSMHPKLISLRCRTKLIIDSAHQNLIPMIHKSFGNLNKSKMAYMV